VPSSAGASDRRLPASPHWLARGVNCVLAIAALSWVWSVFPVIPDPTISKVASRVARGENYDPALLRQMVTQDLEAAERSCNSKILRELLILQIGAAEDSVRATELRQADLDISKVDAISKALLGCAPTESIGWLGVYWSNIRQQGFGPRAASYLGQSYQSAPHEAWIQLIRAPLALRSFGALPPALKEAAVQDFEDIFRAKLFPSAVALLKTSASAQPALLDATCNFPESDRLFFLRLVNDTGSNIRHRCYPSDDRPSYMRE